MVLFIEILAAVFMFIIIFVAIWSFIILNQIFGQLRYKNYLFEKLIQNVHMLASKDNSDVESSSESLTELERDAKEKQDILEANNTDLNDVIDS